jgi:hypothetical protein
LFLNSVLVLAFFVVDSTTIIAQLSQNITRSFLTVYIGTAQVHL